MVIRWSCCISNKTFQNTVQFYKNLLSSIIVTLCIVLANLIPHDGPKHCIFCRDGVSLSKNAFFCCLAWCFYNMHYPPRMGTLSGKIPRSHPILLVGKWVSLLRGTMVSNKNGQYNNSRYKPINCGILHASFGLVPLWMTSTTDSQRVRASAARPA